MVLSSFCVEVDLYSQTCSQYAYISQHAYNLPQHAYNLPQHAYNLSFMSDFQNESSTESLLKERNLNSTDISMLLGKL